MAGLPNPTTQHFEPAPKGTLRVVAWRQVTPTGALPEITQLHQERAQLLHAWAKEQELEVKDWGNTDGAYPREFVELIIPLGQMVLTAAIGALVQDRVTRFFDARKEKKRLAEKAIAANEAPTTPLLAVTVINEKGGTVIFYDRVPKAQLATAASQYMDPKWNGQSEFVG